MAKTHLASIALLGASVLALTPNAVARPPKSGAPKASAQKTVLLLRLEGAGVDPEVIGKLDAAAREQIRASWKSAKLLPVPALDFEAMRVAAGCKDEGSACLATLGTTLGATHVIRIGIGGQPPKKARVVFMGLRIKDGKFKTTKAEIDDLDASATEEFRWHVAMALGDKRPQPPGSIQLAVSGGIGVAEGIEIFLDDKKTGQSALRSVAPGEHRLEVHKEGYDRVIWTGTVRPGREIRVPVSFERKLAKEGAIAQAPLAPLPEVTAKATSTPPIASQSVSMAGAADAKSAGPAERVVAPIQTEPHAHLLYTYIFAGGAVVAAGIGTVFALQLRSSESELNDLCMPTGPTGMETCTTPQTAVSCTRDPDNELCARGRRAQTATFVAFPIAGAFAAAAIAAFFAEDGPALFGGSSSGGGGSALSGAVVPIGGGAAASIGGRF